MNTALSMMPMIMMDTDMTALTLALAFWVIFSTIANYTET